MDGKKLDSYGCLVCDRTPAPCFSTGWAVGKKTAHDLFEGSSVCRLGWGRKVQDPLSSSPSLGYGKGDGTDRVRNWKKVSADRSKLRITCVDYVDEGKMGAWVTDAKEEGSEPVTTAKSRLGRGMYQNTEFKAHPKSNFEKTPTHTLSTHTHTRNSLVLVRPLSRRVAGANHPVRRQHVEGSRAD